jgi:O-antigen ligase
MAANLLLRIPRVWLYLVISLLFGLALAYTANNIMMQGAVLGAVLFLCLFVACLVNIHVWLVLYVLAVALLPQLSFGGMAVQTGDMLFGVGVLLLFRRIRLIQGRVLLGACFGFIAAVIVSVLGIYRFSPTMGSLSAMNSLRIIEVVFPVFLLSTYRKLEYVKLAKCFLIFAVISCLLGVIQFLVQFQVDPKTVWIGSKKFYRAASIFQEANSFGHFSAAVSIVLSILLFEKRSLGGMVKPNRWLIAIGLLISVMAFLLSFSRAAIILYLVGIVFYSLITKRGAIIMKLVGLLAAPVVGLAAFAPQIYALLANRITMTLDGMFTNFDSISGGRVDSWAMAMNLIKDNLYVGVGYKNTALYFLSYYGEYRAGDNNYLTILLELGVIGFTAFLLMTLVLIGWLLQKKEGIGPTLQYCILSVWVATLVQMFVLDSFTFWRSLTALFIFTGVLLSYKSEKKEVIV